MDLLQSLNFCTCASTGSCRVEGHHFHGNCPGSTNVSAIVPEADHLKQLGGLRASMHPQNWQLNGNANGNADTDSHRQSNRQLVLMADLFSCQLSGCIKARSHPKFSGCLALGTIARSGRADHLSPFLLRTALMTFAQGPAHRRTCVKVLSKLKGAVTATGRK